MKLVEKDEVMQDDQEIAKEQKTLVLKTPFLH